MFLRHSFSYALVLLSVMLLNVAGAEGAEAPMYDQIKLLDAQIFEAAFLTCDEEALREVKIADLSKQEIANIGTQLNNTPRKCLGYRTPSKVLMEALAVI